MSTRVGTDWNRVSSVCTLMVAFLIACVFVYDRFLATPSPPSDIIDGWEDVANAGIVRTGGHGAELVVTEFMDFTCPYAVKWSFVSDSLNALYGDRIRIVFHHFPLQNRGHSQTAAIAVECALEQGVFDRMYTSLYQYQDSIGAVGWNWFADRSAVPDLEAFEDCVRRPVEEFPRIGQGRSVGLASGVRGTPTVWLNGEPIAVPSVASFSARVKQ
jgi:protein-disulfide isomerase